MKKQVFWVKSLTICLIGMAIMAGGGFFLLAGTIEIPPAGGNVQAAASFEQKEASPEEDLTTLAAAEVDYPAKEETDEPFIIETTVSAPDNDKVKEETAVDQTAVLSLTSAVETVSVVETQQAESSAQVTYSWGNSGSYTFRIEVKVTNVGADTSRDVVVSVPLLENSSPYQTTTLKSVNYDIVSTSGRISTFNLGDLAPGETKTIAADFNISVRTVSINSSNETIEKARLAFKKYAGSGNCRDLARAFISEITGQGITAREVIGFARPQRGAMTPGSLAGCRHSWAEFYVDGLGWVPVDLTFQYFGTFPQTSHIVESYGDRSINVNFTGGSLSASWNNIIL